MKKNLVTLLAVSLVAFGIEGNAQWQLTGNSNATATSYLGTTNGTQLKLSTKALTRLSIDSVGRVGIGTTTPVNILTVKGAGSTPASTWANAGAPLFVGFGETNVGNADFILGMGAPSSNTRPVFIGRKSRGTLAAPGVVSNNDFLMSFLASGYDGAGFQNPAAIDFYVDGTPSAGNVPARISFVTGSNSSTRAERLKIGSTGDVSVNNTQLTVTQSTGNVSVGTGNLLVAKKANIKGIVGVNGDTLAGTALMVNANATTNGISMTDPVNKYVLYAAKSGTNQGIYVTKSSAASTNGCIVGQSTGTSPGLEGYSKKGNGVYAQSDSSAAVYAVSNTENGVYGQTNSGLKFAGYFNGDVFSTGAYTGSDARLKSNISDFGNAMDIINALQPKNYNFKMEGDYASLQLPKGLHYGLIAQDLEKVLPNLVKESKITIKDYKTNNEDGTEKSHDVSFKAVNYTELIPIMIKGMQEQAKKNEELGIMNDELKTQMSELKMQMEELKALIKGNSTPATEKNSQSVALNSTVGAFLAQNVPNPPLNNSTKISYNIPKAATKAELIITDVYGKKLKQINLANTGRGVLNVDTNGLTAGTYSYTLLVDGKMVETKQMVVGAR